MGSGANSGVLVLKSKRFARFQRQESISDAALREAVANAEKGLIYADLGGGVIKQQVARDGAGKRGGFRTIILYRQGDRAIFVHGFAKSRTDNLSQVELIGLKELAATVLGFTEVELRTWLRDNAVVEVKG